MKSFKDTLDETATWKVKVQGLPGMYMNGKSAGEVKNKLRKLLKNPGDVISDIQRVMPTDVKKDYRLRLTGKRDLEGDDMPIQEKSKGLYYNINKKRKEGRPMRKKGEKGAPTAADFERAAQTAKEGYEGEVSSHLKALDIDHHWKDGHLHVHKRDHKDVKKRLSDTDMEMPKIKTHNESMLGHSDAEKLGKSKDDKFSSAASHIDYHHRQSGGHNKSGGDQDRHRYQVAKKLGYNVEGYSAEINEVDTDTLKSYHKKSQDHMTTALKSNDPKMKKKFGNRLTGSGRAYQKLKARGVSLNNSTDEGYSPDLDPDAQKKKNISTSDKKTLGKIADMMKKEKPTTSESKVKSKAEYDNEGEMAKQQLRTVIDAAEQLMSMLEDNENMPEWVQSKITKAVDYLDSARDYIKSDDKEVSQQEKYLSFTNHMQKQLDEGTQQTVTEAKNMAQIHNDIKKAMDKTKIGYDIVMRGKKHFVKVNHNDEEDAHKAIKNHPLYVSGNLRVMPVK